MALIDELKRRHQELRQKMDELEAQENVIANDLLDLNIAIDALEGPPVATLEQAPAQPVHPDELRDAPPAAEEGSGDQLTAQQMTPEQIEAFLAADKNGGNQSEDFTLLDPAVLRDEPEIPEGWMPVTSDDCPADPHSLVEVIAKYGLITYATQPVVAGEVMWEFQRAYRIVKPAPLIDAQTCEEIDPRVSWKAEPEIPEGFTKWTGDHTPLGAGFLCEVQYRDGQIAGPYPSNEVFAYWLGLESSDDVVAYRIITPEAEPEPDGYAPVVDAEPNPIDAAVEKGAITQHEADLLAAAKAELEEGSTARMFAEGMMADADRHQSDQRSIVEKIGGLFKREREDA